LRPDLKVTNSKIYYKSIIKMCELNPHLVQTYSSYASNRSDTMSGAVNADE
jgi:hypothetical protein